MKATTLNKLSTVAMIITAMLLIAVFAFIIAGEGYFSGVYVDIAFAVSYFVTFALEIARLRKK